MQQDSTGLCISLPIACTLHPLVLKSRLAAILLLLCALFIHLMRSGADAPSGRLQRRLWQEKSLLLRTGDVHQTGFWKREL
jgi:hypothetical protein